MEEKTVDLQSLIFELENVAKYGHKNSDLYRVCIEAKTVIEEYRNLLKKKKSDSTQNNIQKCVGCALNDERMLI